MEKISENISKNASDIKIHMDSANLSSQNFRKSIKKSITTDRPGKNLSNTVNFSITHRYNNEIKDGKNIKFTNNTNINVCKSTVTCNNSPKKNIESIGQQEKNTFDTIDYLFSLKRGKKQNFQFKNNQNQYELRGYKGSTLTPGSHLNQNASKIQLQKLKIFNYINSQNSMQDSIETVQFIKEAVSNSLNIKENKTQTYTNIQMGKNQESLLKKVQLQNQNDKKYNYKIGETRKQIKKIQEWIKDKINFHKESQLRGQTIITDRILYINMAFSDSSRIAGCFSSDLKGLLQCLHNEYHSYYHYLFECLANQNKKIKAQMQLIEGQLKRTISYYQQKQANIKKQQEERSIKVIRNFKKCIQMKQTADKQVKYYKMLYNQEKGKVKVMEEGLLKVISLFLTLGQKSIEQLILTPDKTKTNTNINKSTKSILTKSRKQIQIQEGQNQKRKQIFQQWCGYIVKMVLKIINKNPPNLNQKDRRSVNSVGMMAFQVIQKYLVDNDSNLSMKDAQVILNNFISMDSDLEKIKKQKLTTKSQEANLFTLQKMNSHFNNLYKEVEFQLPTIDEVVKKNKMKSFQIQVCLQKQCDNVSTQCFIKTDQVGCQIFPRTRQRATCMKQHIQGKFKIQQVLNEHQQIRAVPLIKSQKNRISKKQQGQKVPLKYSKSRYSQQSTNKQKKNAKDEIIISLQGQIEFKQKNSNYGITSLQTTQTGVNTDDVVILQSIEKKKKTVDFSIIQENAEEIGNTIKTITINNSQNSKNRISEQSDPSQYNQNIKNKTKRTRKNGIYINGRNKTHISMKFIAMQTEQSQSEDDSKDELQSINISQLNKLVAKTQKQLNFQTDNQNIRKSFDGKQPKNRYETLQERVNKNRSFFNLEDLQFSSKVKADINRIKHLAIKAPKKKLARQKLIDSHDFHLQLAFKNQEKMKFISSVTLWHPRYFSQLKKSKNRIFLHPQSIQVNIKNFNFIKNYINQTIDPILREYVKIFAKEQKSDPFMMTDSLSKSSDFGFNGFTNTFPVSRQKEKQIGKASSNSNQNLFGYSHRLTPLAYLVLNLSSSTIKTKGQVNFYFNCLKCFKQSSSKIQIYNSLIEGGCVQLDIFIRSLHYFNFNLNGGSNQQMISYYSLSAHIFDILQGYCSGVQCEKILKHVLKVSKQANNQAQRYPISQKTQHKIDIGDSRQRAKVNLYMVIKSIFKFIKDRQQIQIKKYQIVEEVISKNCITSYYQDVKYFLECLPLSNLKKNKILSICLKYTVYWQKNEPTIPNDILYFIFDDLELYNGSNLDGISIIKEYLINRCELYFKGTLLKVTKNPDWVLQQTYLLFYKVPKLFHRLSHQAKITKLGGNKKMVLCLLTLIFCNLIDSQMDKRFLPILFNGLFAIPGS